jgi:acyl dehydratase
VTLNAAFVGRTFPSTAPYRVGAEKIREFADAIGDPSAACRRIDAAQALGYADIVAPPTFPVIITVAAARRATSDPDLGLDYSRVVHGSQQFVVTRAVRAGDELVVVVHIDDIRISGSNDIIATRSEVSTVDGEHVCTVRSTLIARGTATAEVTA